MNPSLNAIDLPCVPLGYVEYSITVFSSLFRFPSVEVPPEMRLRELFSCSPLSGETLPVYRETLSLLYVSHPANEPCLRRTQDTLLYSKRCIVLAVVFVL